MSDCLSSICGLSGVLCASCQKDRRIEELELIIVELITESVATNFILDRGYKPAIEKAVLMLGLSKPYGNNRLNIDLTLEQKP